MTMGGAQQDNEKSPSGWPKGGAPQDGMKGSSSEWSGGTSDCDFEPPICPPDFPIVIPNGVRNLRSPSGGLSITTMIHCLRSILDSSSCAPQNDRGEGAPQNDIPNPHLSFRTE